MTFFSIAGNVAKGGNCPPRGVYMITGSSYSLTRVYSGYIMGSETRTSTVAAKGCGTRTSSRSNGWNILNPRKRYTQEEVIAMCKSQGKTKITYNLSNALRYASFIYCSEEKKSNSGNCETKSGSSMTFGIFMQHSDVYEVSMIQEDRGFYCTELCFCKI